MLLKRTLVLTTAVAAAASASLVYATVASADTTIAGTYNAVTPTRVLDTRIGVGAPKAALGPHQTLTFDAAKSLTGQSVSAEALTITAVSPSRTGFLTVYSGGLSRPGTSTLNFRAGETTPNAAIVRFAGTGTVSVFNASKGTVQLAADLSGFWTGGTIDPLTAGAFVPLASMRVLDTRAVGNAPVAPRSDMSVAVTGQRGVPTSNVSAVVVNLTAAFPSRGGYLSATAKADDQDFNTRTSNVNFATKQTRANLVLAPVNPGDGTFSIFNGSFNAVNFVVDIVGYIQDGRPSDDGALVPSTPYRAADTRVTSNPVPSRQTRKIAIVPAGDPAVFKAVVVNVTETHPTAGGYLTTWSGAGTRPTTSGVNFLPGATSADVAIVPLNADGTISVFNGSGGTVDVIIDVHGFVLKDLSAMTAAAASQRTAAVIAGARHLAAAQLTR